MSDYEEVFLALGSNLGDREGLLLTAIQYIDERIGEVITLSRFYETEALSPPGQPPEQTGPLFLNAVLKCQTALSPRQVLQAVREIEDQLGRIRGGTAPGSVPVWAPRTIDIDIISMSDRCIVSESLTLPHPEMHTRDFVLVPLESIDSQFTHPVLGKSVGELILGLRRHFVTGKTFPSRVPRNRLTANG